MLAALPSLVLLAVAAAQQEQLRSMQAAFSRFGSQGVDGGIAEAEMPNFVRYVVESMNPHAEAHEGVLAHSSELTSRLVEQLPAQRGVYSLQQILDAVAKITPPDAAHDDADGARPALGSKQLRTLRARLERNRLTMPLFDTKGWVRDFEKALKIQWEVYANGLAPMHILVARSDRLYGTEVVLDLTSGGAPA